MSGLFRPPDVAACARCGSGRVHPKLLVMGPIGGIDSDSRSFLCEACGYDGLPVMFDTEEARARFEAEKRGPPEASPSEPRQGILSIPILPVLTEPLVDLKVLDLIPVRLASVVGVGWDGRQIAPTRYRASFQEYWDAIGGPRYNAARVFMLDLTGINRANPNFDVLRHLVKRCAVWLDHRARGARDRGGPRGPLHARDPRPPQAAHEGRPRGGEGAGTCAPPDAAEGRPRRRGLTERRSSDPFDVDADLPDEVEALVGPVRRPVVHLRHPGVDDRLRARDARLGRDEGDLAGIVHAHLDERVHLAVHAAASARLVDAAVVVREAPCGPVVAEAVDLGHVLRRDHAADLEPLARRAAREGHREVHDQALEARPLDLPRRLAPGTGQWNRGSGLSFRSRPHRGRHLSRTVVTPCASSRRTTPSRARTSRWPRTSALLSLRIVSARPWWSTWPWVRTIRSTSAGVRPTSRSWDRRAS